MAEPAVLSFDLPDKPIAKTSGWLTTFAQTYYYAV